MGSIHDGMKKERKTLLKIDFLLFVQQASRTTAAWKAAAGIDYSNILKPL